MPAAARLSRSRTVLEVPGIDKMLGERRGSHASAICIGETPFAVTAVAD
jgi:hypothetical protein